ncbi:MAG: hypothetical protein GEU28_11780 [Dehalococcoidia bacterium]|nr:hypothetical protein [Dehalococcoidia bacterium]
MDDIDALRRAIPDCEQLERTSPDQYSGRARVGIAAIKGTYDGTVTLSDRRELSGLHVSVEAKSGHARIAGEGDITLSDDDGGTRAEYSGDARVIGPLAAVAQRLLPTFSKAQINEFFKRLDAHLYADTAANSTVENKP